MSEENVELTRGLLDRLNAVGRIDEVAAAPEEAFGELWERLDPEVELRGRPDIPDTSNYRGQDGFRQFFEELGQVFSEVRWEGEELIDCGNAVVFVGKVVGVGRGSDVPVEMSEADVVWFRDGKVVCTAGFPTREEALAAVEAGRDSG